MACQGFAGQLKDVAAGGDPTPRFRAHIDQCPACRAELARERHLLGSIDNDLAREMRVEPSAEFQAHIRARIASEPVATRWFGGWRLASALASAAVVVVVLAIAIARWGGLGGERTGTTASRPGPRDSDSVRVQPVVPTPHGDDLKRPDGLQAVETSRVAKASVVAAPRPRPPRAFEPEVLVPRDQQIAIARLLATVHTAKVDEKALAQAAEPPQPPEAIVVGELTVPPIVVAQGIPDKQQ